MTDSNRSDLHPAAALAETHTYKAVLLGSGILGTVEIVKDVPLTHSGRPHSTLKRQFITAAGPKFMFWAAGGPFVDGEQDYRPCGTRYVNDTEPFPGAYELPPQEPEHL